MRSTPSVAARAASSAAWPRSGAATTSSLTSLARAWAMTSRPAAVVVVAEGLATSRARTALTVAPGPPALGVVHGSRGTGDLG